MGRPVDRPGPDVRGPDLPADPRPRRRGDRRGTLPVGRPCRRCGRWPAGSASTRNVAKAYERLRGEGFLRTTSKSGSVVARGPGDPPSPPHVVDDWRARVHTLLAEGHAHGVPDVVAVCREVLALAPATREPRARRPVNHVSTTAIGVGACLLVGLTLLLLPSLSARTLPLGVSVPRERADAPVRAAPVGHLPDRRRRPDGGERARRRARWGPREVPARRVRAPGPGVAPFVLCRRPIRAAIVRGVVPGGAGPPHRALGRRAPPARRPVHWYVLALALVLATAAFGWTPTTPCRTPSRRTGTATAGPTRSRPAPSWSAFGPLLVAVGLTVLLARPRALCVGHRCVRARGHRPPRPAAGDRARRPVAAGGRRPARRGAGLRVRPRRVAAAPGAPALGGVTLVVFGAALAVTVLVTAVRSRRRARRRTPVRAGPRRHDRLWRGGPALRQRGGPRPARPQARRGRLDAQRRPPAGGRSRSGCCCSCGRSRRGLAATLPSWLLRPSGPLRGPHVSS